MRSSWGHEAGGEIISPAAVEQRVVADEGRQRCPFAAELSVRRSTFSGQMRRVVRGTLLVISPLVVIVIVALAVFGTAGPADDDARANAGFRLLGMLYGVYLVALSYFWWKRRNSPDAKS